VFTGIQGVRMALMQHQSNARTGIYETANVDPI
jgi:hypothetical protein